MFVYSRLLGPEFVHEFVHSSHVSGFTFRMKQDTFVKVYHEFVNSKAAFRF